MPYNESFETFLVGKLEFFNKKIPYLDARLGYNNDNDSFVIYTNREQTFTDHYQKHEAYLFKQIITSNMCGNIIFTWDEEKFNTTKTFEVFPMKEEKCLKQIPSKKFEFNCIFDILKPLSCKDKVALINVMEIKFQLKPEEIKEIARIMVIPNKTLFNEYPSLSINKIIECVTESMKVVFKYETDETNWIAKFSTEDGSPIIESIFPICDYSLPHMKSLILSDFLFFISNKVKRAS